MSNMFDFGGRAFKGVDPFGTKKNAEGLEREEIKEAEKRHEHLKSKKITLTLDEFKEKSAKVLMGGQFSKELRAKDPSIGLLVALMGTALIAEISVELFKEDTDNDR